MRIDGRLKFVLFLILAGVFMRVVPHPWGVTPIGAMALLGGAKLRRRPFLAFLLPLGSLFLGDFLAEVMTGNGLHAGMPVVYASFALMVVIGAFAGEGGERRRSGIAPLRLLAGVVSGSTLFYLTTNFWVWTISSVYPPTFAGLAACYLAGLPFHGTQLGADLLFTALLFRLWAVLFETSDEAALAGRAAGG